MDISLSLTVVTTAISLIPGAHCRGCGNTSSDDHSRIDHVCPIPCSVTLVALLRAATIAAGRMMLLVLWAAHQKGTNVLECSQHDMEGLFQHAHEGA